VDADGTCNAGRDWSNDTGNYGDINDFSVRCHVHHRAYDAERPDLWAIWVDHLPAGTKVQGADSTWWTSGETRTPKVAKGYQWNKDDQLWYAYTTGRGVKRASLGHYDHEEDAAAAARAYVEHGITEGQKGRRIKGRWSQHPGVHWDKDRNRWRVGTKRYKTEADAIQAADEAA
jgi:hypothetical protein